MEKIKKESRIFLTLQTIGRAFFLPVSILPVAGLLLGLGASFTNEKTIAYYHSFVSDNSHKIKGIFT